MAFSLLLLAACNTLPTPRQRPYVFPKSSVYLGGVDRPYTVLGWVKTKVNYTSLDPNFEEDELCRNYFNKAANDLLDRAKKSGGDAVLELKSVVFLEDGRQETYSTPECADDGQEGQILAQGISIRWNQEEDRKAPPLFMRVPSSLPGPSVPKSSPSVK